MPFWLCRCALTVIYYINMLFHTPPIFSFDSETIYDWLYNYLINIYQVTKINNEVSNPA